MKPTRVPLLMAMLVLVLVLAALDQTILATALPTIAHDFHGGDRLSWVFSAYLIASTVVIPLYGRLADIHGSKPMLLAAIALFLSGSVACGLSTDMTQLIAARAVQGAGGGGLMTLAMLAVVDLATPQTRARFQGLLGASYGLATMFGPLLGGVLVEHLSWRWAFYINAPLALAALAVLALQFPRTPARHPHRLDVIGAALLAGAAVSLLLAVRRDAAVTAAQTTVLALLALKLCVAFVLAQRKARHPIVPLSLFGVRAFTGATLISMVTGVALFAAVVFLPMYLQTALHLTPTNSAWHLLPLMAGLTAAAITGGRALRGGGAVRPLALAGCTMAALAFVALAAVLAHWPGEALAISASVLPLGVALGMLFPLVTMVSQRSAPPAQMGIATAAPIMVRSLGGAVGVAALGSLLSRGMATRMAAVTVGSDVQAAAATAFAQSLQPVFWSAAALCALAALAALWLPMHMSSALPAGGEPAAQAA